MVRIAMHRAPKHPSEMLRQEFLLPIHISQRNLADALHVPYKPVSVSVNSLINDAASLRVLHFG